jgi:hypothetical protein
MALSPFAAMNRYTKVISLLSEGSTGARLLLPRITWVAACASVLGILLHDWPIKIERDRQSEGIAQDLLAQMPYRANFESSGYGCVSQSHGARSARLLTQPAT